MNYITIIESDYFKQLLKQCEGMSESDILFKYHQKLDFDPRLLVNQLEGKKRIKHKLPTWSSQPIIFPPKLNIEQSSSESTALFKSSLYKGKKMIDLTGGFGVDSYYFAQNFEKVIHVEKNIELSEIVKKNYQLLNQSNIECIQNNSLEYIKNTSDFFDLIYLDPARRKAGEKVFKFTDCEPNILAIKNNLFEKTDTILIKASPMADIKACLAELENVSQVFIVGNQTECKELIFELKKEKKQIDDIIINTIELEGNNVKNQLSFTFTEENNAKTNFSSVKKYLYEPNPVFQKAGPYKTIATKFQIEKLHRNTQLFTSDHIKPNFVGRSYEVISTINYNAKSIKKTLPSLKANIKTRNFPETVEQIKQKLKLKDGGDIYIFACTLLDETKQLIICKKI